MKILFGQKYYGKDTSEVPSGFLVWIIEEFRQADWTLVDAAKQELASRLKLDWSPKTIEQKELETLTRRVSELERERDFLLDAVMMSIECRGNYHIVEGYLNNPQYMYQVMSVMKDCQN